ASALLDDFTKTSQCFLLVDGLDRVSAASEVRGLLDFLDDLVRRTLRKACVIVADRLNLRAFLEEREWEFAVMDHLEPNEVERHIGAVAYRKLSERQRELLQSPYVLQEAMKSGTPFWASTPEAMNSFMVYTIELEETKFKLLAI